MTAPAVDDDETGRTAVYLIYDRDDRLLYVGCSLNPIVRWMDHAKKP